MDKQDLTPAERALAESEAADVLDAMSSKDATGKVNEMLTESPKVRQDVRGAMQNTFKSKAAKDMGWSRGDYDWVNGRPQVRPPAPVVEAPAPGGVQEEPVMPGEGPVMPDGPVVEEPIIETPFIEPILYMGPSLVSMERPAH